MDAVEQTTELVRRLDRGWLLIEQATNPVKRAHLEDHWLELLRQYEALVDAEMESEAA
jgi:hypothetical protein